MRETLAYLWHHRTGRIGVCLVTFMVLVAIFAPLIAPYGPNEQIRGAELMLTLRPAAWLEGSAAWTITEAFDATTGLRLPRRPEHVVSVTARLAPLPRLVIAPTLLFVGRSPVSRSEMIGQQRGQQRRDRISPWTFRWSLRGLRRHMPASVGSTALATAMALPRYNTPVQVYSTVPQISSA